jgi:hypothetical protein
MPPNDEVVERPDARASGAPTGHGPLQPSVRHHADHALENPPLQKYSRNGRHTENEQEYRELLGQGVPGLRNAHP